MRMAEKKIADVTKGIPYSTWNQRRMKNEYGLLVILKNHVH